MSDKPIAKMLVKDLREELSKRGLDTKGLKQELVERLEQAIAQQTEHEKHVEAGLVGALSNENTSEAAKEKINEKLDQLHTEGKVEEHNLSEEEKHQHRVEGGLKAAIANESTSEEAKTAAQEKLDIMEVTGEVVEKKELSEEEKHQHRVEGGLKGAIANENNSEEAKSEAQERLDVLQVTGELPEKKELTEEEKHQHHVEGGLKAALSNPNTTEEGKQAAAEALSANGVPAEPTDYSAKEEPKVAESEKPAGVEEPVAQLAENREKEMVASNVDNGAKSEEAKKITEIDETAKLSTVLKMRDPTLPPISRTVAPVSMTVDSDESKKRKMEEEQLNGEKKSKTEGSDQPSAISSN